MFAQELNLVPVAAQNMFYNADLGDGHEHNFICI